MDRDLPFHRQSAAAPLRAALEARSAVFGDRPCGCRGYPRWAAPGARACRQGAALPAQGNLPADLFLSGEHGARLEGYARRAVSLVRTVGDAALQALSRLRGEETALQPSRLRRSASVLARDDGGDAACGARERQLRSRARR